MAHALPDIAFFHQLADAAAQQTLPRFRSAQELHVGSKPRRGSGLTPSPMQTGKQNGNPPDYYGTLPGTQHSR